MPDWLPALVALAEGIAMAAMAAGGNENEQNRKDRKDGGSGAGGAPGSVENAGAAEGGAFEGTAPDYTSYFTGWRAWRVTREGRLGSISDDQEWPAKAALRAACKRDSAHVRPQEECTCGIYAHKTREDALQEWSGNSDCGAVGEVALWGRVIMAERGFRAEFAYPLTLQISPNFPVLAARRLEEYGVPVEILPEDVAPSAPNRTPVSVPPMVVPPTVGPRGSHPAMAFFHGFSIAMQLPSMVYSTRMAVGMFYRSIELCKEAQGFVDSVELLLNGSVSISRVPLSMLGRGSGGNYLIFDGLRDGTALDSRLLAALELRVYFAPSFPPGIIPPPQLTVGYLYHV